MAITDATLLIVMGMRIVKGTRMTMTMTTVGVAEMQAEFDGVLFLVKGLRGPIPGCIACHMNDIEKSSDMF
jgi:hypothetical protein